MTEFETIDDKALEQVTGGLTISIGSLSVSAGLESGLSATSPLGSISIASPLTIIGDLIGETANAVGTLLTRFGGRLQQLGQLFDFS